MSLRPQTAGTGLHNFLHMNLELFNETFTTIKRNKLRTALTGFAVAWGIFILIVLLGAGNGLLNALASNQGNFLANSMMVFGGFTSKAYDGLAEGRSIKLNDADLGVTRNGFADNVEEVGAELLKAGQTFTYAGNYTADVGVNGVFPNEITINKRKMLRGRFIDQLDMREQRKTVVVSSNIAKELMPDDPLALAGKTVKVGNLGFLVAGIYRSESNGMGNDAFIPFTTFRTIYNSGNEVGNIVFSFGNLDTEADNEAFEAAYRARINSMHRAAPDDDAAVWIWNRFTQNMQMNTANSIVSTALWIIGILTLLSGIVGVSNIMLITVKERTREIGIRKAIGATPWSVLRLIMVESITITTFFGYVGMLLGIAATLYMDATIGQTAIDTGLFQARMFVNPTVGIGVCVKATLVMIVSGTIAGLVPARRAARVRPIEALRAE